LRCDDNFEYSKFVDNDGLDNEGLGENDYILNNIDNYVKLVLKQDSSQIFLDIIKNDI
jgi:hypothetical protein